MSPRPTPTAPRTCKVCRRALPLEAFRPSGTGNGRRTTCTRCLKEADRARRRAQGVKIRHPRYNARGHVWCNRCEQYLPPYEFKRHPSRPHTFWSYCRACVRIIDRERYRKKNATLEGAQADQAKRQARKRRQRRRVDRERRDFVASSILTLRKRGFTKAEIARLVDTHLTSLLDWEKKSRRVTQAVEDRFVVVLMATAHLPLGEPAYRRRRPHPEYERIYNTVHKKVVAIPVRSRWTDERNAA